MFTLFNKDSDEQEVTAPKEIVSDSHAPFFIPVLSNRDRSNSPSARRGSLSLGEHEPMKQVILPQNASLKSMHQASLNTKYYDVVDMGADTGRSRNLSLSFINKNKPKTTQEPEVIANPAPIIK